MCYLIVFCHLLFSYFILCTSHTWIWSVIYFIILFCHNISYVLDIIGFVWVKQIVCVGCSRIRIKVDFRSSMDLCTLAWGSSQCNQSQRETIPKTRADSYIYIPFKRCILLFGCKEKLTKVLHWCPNTMINIQGFLHHEQMWIKKLIQESRIHLIT